MVREIKKLRQRYFSYNKEEKMEKLRGFEIAKGFEQSQIN